MATANGVLTGMTCCMWSRPMAANAHNSVAASRHFLPDSWSRKSAGRRNAAIVKQQGKLEMGNHYRAQSASRLGRSIVTQIATAQTNATQFTTPFSAQTYQVRIISTLPIWATIGTTAVVTANSAATYLAANAFEYFACTAGQVLNFISTSTSTGYVTFTEMT